MINKDDYRVKVMSDKTLTLKNKMDIPLHGISPEATITVEVDRDGVPFDRNWRKRLRDSKIDNCVEIVKKGKK